MNMAEARLELLNIKSSLNKILDDYHKNTFITYEEEKKIRDDINRLHRAYIKICVCLDRKVPDYNNGKWPYFNNCYCYAMNFRKPEIFQDLYNDIFYEYFCDSLGTISEISLPKYFTEENLLDTLYCDLDALKIRHYRSWIDKSAMHGGYKIAVYMLDRENSATHRPDYHFIRQNSNGIWSCKNGLNEGIHIVDDPYNLEKYPKYELVRVLEIVKPNLCELKPSDF